MKNYCIRTCVPITHTNGRNHEDVHSHTMEVSTYLLVAGDGFYPYSAIEGRIDQFFARYAGKFLNDMPEFEGDATVENMGEVFFAQLTTALEGSNLTLERLEIGETPLRVYAVGIEQSSA